MIEVTRKPHRVFIVGSPRSGTTLLQSMLAAHDDVQGFTESHFFDKGYKKKSGFGTWRLQPELEKRVRRFFADNPATSFTSADELLSRITGNAVSDVQVLTSLFDRVVEKEGKSVWLEKTPDNVRRIPLIKAAIPDAVFVHIFRRPVDTILSLRKAKQQWGGNNSWLHCFGHWFVAMHISRSYIGNPDHYFVAYETLTQTPEATLNALTSWLRLNSDDNLMSKRVASTTSLVRHHEVWKANNFQEIKYREPASDAGLPMWLRLVIRNVGVYEKLLQTAQSMASEMSPQNNGRQIPEVTGMQVETKQTV